MSKLEATCQICGSRHLLNTSGRLIRHGWAAHNVRHGEHSGWHTGPCAGAGYAPFEESRDHLGAVITQLREQLRVRREEVIPAWENPNATALPLLAVGGHLFVERSPAGLRLFEDVRTGLGKQRRREEVPAEAWRATLSRQLYWHGEDAALEVEVRWHRARSQRVQEMRVEADNLEAHIASQQARFDGWQPNPAGITPREEPAALPVAGYKVRHARFGGEYRIYPVDANGRKTDGEVFYGYGSGMKADAHLRRVCAEKGVKAF